SSSAADLRPTTPLRLGPSASGRSVWQAAQVWNSALPCSASAAAAVPATRRRAAPSTAPEIDFFIFFLPFVCCFGPSHACTSGPGLLRYFSVIALADQ